MLLLLLAQLGQGWFVEQLVAQQPPKQPFTISISALKPGESVSEVTNLARWVDFSQPGEYVIQVSRNIGDDEKQGVVKSNIITITVVAPPPEAAAPK